MIQLRPLPLTSFAIVVGIWAALTPLVDVFQGGGWFLRIAFGALLAAVVASVLETIYEDLPVPVAALSAGAGAVLWGILILAGSSSTGGSPIANVRDGLFGGWSALLDDASPLRDAPPAEMFVGLVVWVVTASAVHFAARRNNGLIAIAAFAWVLWMSVAAALPTGLSPAIYGTGAGMSALLVVATLSRGVDEPWQRTRVLTLLLILLVSAGLAALLVSVSGFAHREASDPRSSRDTAQEVVEIPDILGEYAARRAESDELLTVEAAGSDGLPEGLRLRLQTYEQHDGERWTPTTDFREVGTYPTLGVLPPGEFVALRVDINDIDGPWIPVPDRLVSTSLTDIRWSEGSQTGLFSSTLNTYELTGTVVGREGLEGVISARDEVDEIYTDVPAALPDSIRRAAETAAANAPDTISAIDALTATVREIGRDDAIAPGHSLARLRNDLDAGTPTGAEQLVSLHALMIRSLGHPARVVVGFEVKDSIVRSSDLHVWTEVAFPDVGWVALDPVPPPPEGVAEGTPENDSTTTTLPDETVVGAAALPRELGPGEDPDEADSSGGGLTVFHLIVALFVLIIFGLIFLAATRISRRRARRTSETAEHQILGAWAELVDRLREAGAPIASTTTIDDVTYMAATMDPDLGRSTDELGTLASAALYSPIGCSEDDASKAWQTLPDAEAVLVHLRGHRVFAQRLLDPRALRFDAPAPPRSRDISRR